MRWLVVGLVVLVFAATVAHAGPLGVAWQRDLPDAQCRQLVDTGGQLVERYAAKTFTRYDGATGKPTTLAMPKLGLALAPKDRAWLTLAIGDMLVYEYFDHATFAIDRTTGALRWRRDGPDLMSTRAIGGDAVIASFSKSAFHVERLDAATGTSRWQVDVATKRAELTWVGAGGSRVMLIADDHKAGESETATTLLALDAATGKLAWTTDEASTVFGHYTFVGDDLVEDTSDEVHVFAAARGAKTTYERPSKDTLLIRDTRMFTMERHADGDEVIALEALTGTELWRAKLASQDTALLGASPWLLYVAGDAGLLYQIEIAKGAVVAAYGVDGFAPRIEIHDTGPPVTSCVGKRLVALDPGARDTSEHRVTVTGRIACRTCETGRALEVRIGEDSATPDAKGRFTIATTARGTVPLQVRYADYFAWTRIRGIAFARDAKVDLGILRVAVPDRPDD